MAGTYTITKTISRTDKYAFEVSFNGKKSEYTEVDIDVLQRLHEDLIQERLIVVSNIALINEKITVFENASNRETDEVLIQKGQEYLQRFHDDVQMNEKKLSELDIDITDIQQSLTNPPSYISSQLQQIADDDLARLQVTNLASVEVVDGQIVL